MIYLANSGILLTSEQSLPKSLTGQIGTMNTTISNIDIDTIQLIDEKLSNALLLRADTIDSKKHLINDMIEELLDERLRVVKDV